MMYVNDGRNGRIGNFFVKRKVVCIFAVLCSFAFLGLIVYLTYAGDTTRYCETPGKKISHNGKITVDYSNAGNGYVAVKHEETSRKTKIRVICGKSVDTYNLVCDGRYNFFPLKNGTGTYEISIYAQASGTKYAQVFGTDFYAKIDDKNSCFLYPNQRAWYEEGSEVVALADELCKGLETDLEKIQTLYKWVSTNVKYDYIFALNAESTYLPDNEATIATKKGLCYDFASLLCAMLRSQGVYCQIAIGSLNNTQYHAWNRVLLNGEWKMLDATFPNKYTSSAYKMDGYY